MPFGECGLLPFRLPCQDPEICTGPPTHVGHSTTPGPGTPVSEIPDMTSSKVAPEGGLVAFRKRPRDSEPVPAIPEHAEESLTQLIAKDLDAIESKPELTVAATEPAEPPAKKTRVIQIIHVPDNTVQTICFDACAPLHTVVAAEHALTAGREVRLFTTVGTAIDVDQHASPFQQIVAYTFLASDQTVPDCRRHPPFLTAHDSCTRIQLLRKQGAWVAMDEMMYYLHMLEATGHTAVASPCFVPPHSIEDELADNLQRWFDGCALQCASVTQVATALLIDDHWIPVIFRASVNAVQVLTVIDGVEWIDAASQHLTKAPQTTVVAMTKVFSFDCGFQTVSWLLSMVMYADYDEFAPTFDVDTAVTWRGRFEHNLFVTGQALTIVRPADLHFGGVAKHDLHGQLVLLLESHGVPAKQSHSRADTVLDKIGRSQVANVLRAAQPWRDLKALANQCSPKLQLVLSSEMQIAIEARLQDPKPFGSRKKKISKPVQGSIALEPEDISVPDGIFKEGDTTPLNQIQLAQIGPQARGIVVVTSAQASPYLKVAQPVSAVGLALLVLDHDAGTIQGLGELIRLPAHCNRSGEPLLLTAKLIQLGSVIVTRLVAPQIPRVEEVSNAVIKTLVYRDEIGPEWDDFMRRPVTWILQQVPDLQTTNVDQPKILDCWDRQTLSAKMEKTPPAKAAIFVVSLRVAHLDIESVMKKSGFDSLYFEPRTEDGKGHDDKYRVIWLNKTTKATALLAVQSTEVWCCLVRSGDRFGLRVQVKHAAQVHAQHRPALPYLDAQTLLTYIAGPFPYGATKQSLSKLFALWSWPARPIQPRGKSSDQTGVMWEILASAAPQYGVYQLEHADVLITEQPKKTRGSTGPRQNIQGSAKTIAALTKQVVQADTPSTGDPWQTGASDPWSNYNPPAKVARHHDDSLPQASVDSITNKVEKKVMQALEHKLARSVDGDAAMSAMEDTRIADLEAKLLHLEHTVQMNQVTQERNHLEVTTHVATLQNQVESQSSQLQQHFDQRMSEQLMHIERLLKKRSGE